MLQSVGSFEQCVSYYFIIEFELFSDMLPNIRCPMEKHSPITVFDQRLLTPKGKYCIIPSVVLVSFLVLHTVRERLVSEELDFANSAASIH